jgi:hypothetical protein
MFSHQTIGYNFIIALTFVLNFSITIPKFVAIFFIFSSHNWYPFCLARKKLVTFVFLSMYMKKQKNVRGDTVFLLLSSSSTWNDQKTKSKNQFEHSPFVVIVYNNEIKKNVQRRGTPPCVIVYQEATKKRWKEGLWVVHYLLLFFSQFAMV